MSDLTLFQDLNHRLAQIVEELVAVEDELKKIMTTRTSTLKREYWTIRMQNKKDVNRTLFYYCREENMVGFHRRSELSEEEMKKIIPGFKQHCLKRFGHNIKIIPVKVKVYSRIG